MRTFFHLSVLFISIIIPGAGFALSKRPWLAPLVSLIGLFWVMLLSFTRLVTSEVGFYLLLIGLGAIHLVGYCWAVVLLYKNKRTKLKHTTTLLSLISCVIIFSGILLASHKHKAEWYGFELYQIPSVSMEPTLSIGDIIFVDTWAYKKNTPQTGDIVVFKRNEKSAVLIKRISKTRTTANGIEIWVLGDNAARSQDSRTFGWVQTDYLLGKSKFVWFNLFSLLNPKH